MTTAAAGAPAQTTFLGRLGQAIMNVATHQVFPFLAHLWSIIQLDVINKLMPIALNELDTVDQALITGGPEDALKVFNATVPKVLQSAEAAAAGATLHDVITTVSAAMAHKQAQIAAAATAATTEAPKPAA